MSSDFEETFVKILHAHERRLRKEKAETRGGKPLPIQFGDTTAGKVLATGLVPEVERTTIHEIPAAKGHASRAHKKSGTGRNIRKVGVTWR